MRRLGVHTSIAGGLHLSLERAHTLGCNTLQIFSHNPRGWEVKILSDREASRFRSLRAELDISPVFIHASYLVNLASRDGALRRKSIGMLVTEMERADKIGADYVILHTGSASGDGRDAARTRAIESLRKAACLGRWNAGLLLENTAGKRGDISSTIRELSEILKSVDGPLLSGICWDTCHAFAAGYDIRETGGADMISSEVEKYIGLDRLKLIHLNDSKGDAGSGVDRHEHIGLGNMGISALSRFINRRAFRNIPLILETPKKNEADDLINLTKVRKMTISQ